MSKNDLQSSLDGNISLNIEQTNVLRAKLGLKPLNALESQKDTEIVIEPVTKRKTKTAELRRRIDDTKASLLRKEIIESSSLLNESDINLSNVEWVERMRKTQKIDSKVNLEDEDTEELDFEKEVTTVDKSTRIVHKLHDLDLKGGDSLYLTLKDTSIIDETGDLRESTCDLLENTDITAKEKREKYLKEKRAMMMGESLTEALEDTMIDFVNENPIAPKTKEILPHYDEWAAELGLKKKTEDSKGFTVGDLEKFEGNLPTNFPEPVNLLSNQGIQRDYLTPEESQKVLKTTFKRKKVTNSVRKKPKVEEEDDKSLDATQMPLSSTAIEKKKNQSSMTLADEPSYVQDLINEDDDDLLYKQLASRRKTAAMESVDTLIAIQKFEEAEALMASGVQSVVGSVNINPTELCTHSTSKIELSGTSEFCRAVPTPLELLEELQAKQSQFTTVKRGLSQKNESIVEKPLGVVLTENPELDTDLYKNELELEDKNFVKEVINEQVMDLGCASALKLLKERNELKPISFSKKRHSADNKPFEDTSSDIRLEYRDDYGRLMTPKEAFRYISWVFHGKGPGRNKREKILRKLEMERKAHAIADNVNRLPTLRALQKQQKTGSAYLVLSSTNNS